MLYSGAKGTMTSDQWMSVFFAGTLVDQVMQSVGKRPWHQLRLQVHRQQPWTHINSLVSRHRCHLAD